MLLPRPLFRPLPLLAAGGGALVLLGGTLAIIVGCGALLLALDRALPAGSAALPRAEPSFRRLVRARRRELMLGRLRRRPSSDEHLLCLALDRGWAAVAQHRHLGVQAIAVDSIVGTVEPHKAEAFDSRFRPPRWSRDRWTRLCEAAQRGTALPPISVYRVGERHFVRDGHHRVSVAAALATVDIEADVVELRPVRPTHVTSAAFDGYRRQLSA
jgi:hypothetical protein